MEDVKKSIAPTQSQFSEVRAEIESQVSRFEHRIEIEEAQFYLGFQPMERGTNHIIDGTDVLLEIDPSKEWKEEIELSILRALLEIKYEQNTENSTELFWQELKRAVYVECITDDILARETVKPSLEDEWKDLRNSIKTGKEMENYYHLLGSLAREMASEVESPDKLKGYSREKLLELGDILYGDE